MADSTNDPHMDYLVNEAVPVEEEVWESEIEKLLGALPMVDPPEGFLDAAVDHRPLYAGRALVTTGLASLLVLAGFSALGLFAKETFVPDLDGLVSRHTATQAGVLGVDLPGGDSEYVFELIDDVDKAEPAPIELTGQFQWEADFGYEDLRQAVFANDDHVISVFEEPGHINFDELASEGLIDIDGVLGWSDPARDVILIQTSDSIITVVGVTPEGLDDIVADIDSTERSDTEQLLDRINRATRQLGFPDLR